MSFTLFYTSLSFWTSAISLILGGLVFFKNRHGSINRTFGLLSFSIALWSLGLGLLLSSHEKEQALFWGRMSHVGAIAIAPFFAHFTFALLYLYKKKTKLLVLLYLFSLWFLSVSFSSRFIYDVRPIYFFIKGGHRFNSSATQGKAFYYRGRHLWRLTLEGMILSMALKVR